jgi:hypothetical protein
MIEVNSTVELRLLPTQLGRSEALSSLLDGINQFLLRTNRMLVSGFSWVIGSFFLVLACLVPSVFWFLDRHARRPRDADSRRRVCEEVTKLRQSVEGVRRESEESVHRFESQISTLGQSLDSARRLDLVYHAPKSQLSPALHIEGANAESADQYDRCVRSLRRLLGTDSSRFENLILVSYLRDANEGRRLNMLTREYSYGEVISGLRQLHMEMFLDWLNVSLSERQADIRVYLADPDDRTRMLASLVDTGCDVIPPEAKMHEAQLFAQDLEMIRVGLGGGAPKTPTPLFRQFRLESLTHAKPVGVE